MALKHLHHKLVIYILCSAIVIAGVAVSFSFMMEFNRSKAHAEVMLTQLMDTVEKTAAIAAYSRDKVIAKDVIDGLLRNDIVHTASISSDKLNLAEESKQILIETPQQYTRPLGSPYKSMQFIYNQ